MIPNSPPNEFGIGMSDKSANASDVDTFAKVATNARIAYENALHGMYAVPDVARSECIRYLRQAAEALNCRLVEPMTEEDLLMGLRRAIAVGPDDRDPVGKVLR